MRRYYACGICCNEAEAHGGTKLAKPSWFAVTFSKNEASPSVAFGFRAGRMWKRF